MLTTRIDARILVCFGILWLGDVSFLRTLTGAIGAARRSAQPPERAMAMQANGLSPEQAGAALDHMVQSQGFSAGRRPARRRG